mmetsp:Transcript_17053/g.32354  ORF Transcript_17053/g.32354 Transcript_17053/m.32354 type:complete len:242 (-) Transcript_17053:212-937(-)
MHPECNSYLQLGNATGGAKLGVVCKWVTVVSWFGVLPLYLLTAAKAMQGAFDTPLCSYMWSLILALLLSPFLLLRNLKSIEWLITFSDFTVGFIVVSLLINLGLDRDPDAKIRMTPAEGQEFFEAYNPVSSFIFAYQGQSVFLEIMSEMKDSSEWPKALWLGQSIMIPVYTATAFAGYYFQGDNVPDFLPDALSDGPLKTIIDIFIAYHVLAAYLLNNVALVVINVSICYHYYLCRAITVW